MSRIDAQNSLLLIIDIQDKLIDASFCRDLCHKKSEIISKAAQILKIPTIVTEQYPKGLGGTITEIKNSLCEDALFFEKMSFSALDNTSIAEAIKQAGKKQIIVMGIETHICVSQTIDALINEGYEAFIITDASSSRSEKEHSAGLERIKSNGGSLVTTEIVIFEWLRGAKHPNFKDIQALIK